MTRLTAAILAYLLLGFVLGRVTAPVVSAAIVPSETPHLSTPGPSEVPWVDYYTTR